MAAELTAKLAFCSVLERSFDDILVCEWIQTGVKNTKNRRFLNVVLTTSLYVNGFKQVSKLCLSAWLGARAGSGSGLGARGSGLVPV